MTGIPSSFLKSDLTQTEKKAILRQDRQATSYNKLAQASDPESLGGRFATGATIIPGQHSHVNYPPQPFTSPWNGPQVPDEPPLGYSVDEMPICGEPHEQIEKASPETQQGLTRSGPTCVEDGADPVNTNGPDHSTTRVEQASSGLSHLADDVELASEHGSAPALKPAQRSFLSAPLAEASTDAGVFEQVGTPAVAGAVGQPSAAPAISSTLRKRKFV
jgi:hypothetical protein